MKKVVKTYPSGCIWCTGRGFVNNPNGLTTNTTVVCPVCSGSGIITVTETYDPLYAVTFEKENYEDLALKTFKIPESRIESIKRIQSDVLTDNLPSNNTVITLFKARRLMNHLTLRDIAKKTGLSASTIMRIENGNKCMADNYNALLKFWKDYGTHI